MESIRKTLFSLMLVLTAFSIYGCDSDGNSVPINVEDVSDKIIGVWYCTYQQKTEKGKTDIAEYEPSSEYSMVFNEDGTGYMTSGSDELFEIGRYNSFKWYAYRDNGAMWIHTDVYDGEDYKINSLTSNNLIMTWTDEDYSIMCKFVKQDE